MSDNATDKRWLGWRKGRASRQPGYPSSIEPFPGDPGAWDPDRLVASLAAMHNATVTAVQGRIDWYSGKAGFQGRVARYLRFAALILVGAGALVPLAAPMLTATGSAGASGGGVEVTQFGYIAIAVAGILVGLDNFFGFSESWMRFRTTEAELVRRLAAFRYDWASRLAADDVAKDRSVLLGLLDLQRRFMDSVEAAVEAETAQWAAGQRMRMLSFDRKQEFERYDEVPGQVRVEVDGWDKLAAVADRKKVTASIGGVALALGDDGSAVSPRLKPGRHTVLVERTGKAGATARTSKEVTVVSEQTVMAAVPLPVLE